ncbi:MAG: hypothetical protein H7X97_00400, partial [Opitutaceae bacterium]|nr:hypothetical protein [Verrucomicrobiales bacterium]
MTALITVQGIAVWTGLIAAVLIGIYWLLGMVLIHEQQVGIVIKRFASRSLPPGRLVALD